MYTTVCLIYTPSHIKYNPSITAAATTIHTIQQQRLHTIQQQLIS